MMLEQGLSHNQLFLDRILAYMNETEEGATFQPEAETTPNNKSKIKSTVKQFYREWCGESP